MTPSGPRGLVPHTHEDRRRILERLVTQLNRRFGANLIAVAATGSFARGDDGPWSDLEITVFLHEPPKGAIGIGSIHKGMLIEVIWTTKDAWLDMVCRKPGHDWHLAGSDRLQPVVNAQFISALKAEAEKVTRAQCRDLIPRHWRQAQEATGKVLKAAALGDREGLSLVYPDMVRLVLITLAVLNARPFTTFVRMIAEARGFDMLPASFEAMVEALRGGYDDPAAISVLALGVFEEVEGLLELAGLKLYEDDLSAFDEDVDV